MATDHSTSGQSPILRCGPDDSGLALTPEELSALRTLFDACYEGFNELWTVALVVKSYTSDEIPKRVDPRSLLDMLAAQALRTASSASEAFSDLDSILGGYRGGQLFELTMHKLLEPDPNAQEEVSHG